MKKKILVLALAAVFVSLLALGSAACTVVVGLLAAKAGAGVARYLPFCGQNRLSLHNFQDRGVAANANGQFRRANASL